MRTEVRQARSAEVVDRLKAVRFHKRQQALAHFLDHPVAVNHHAGTDLDQVRTEQNKLGGIFA